MRICENHFTTENFLEINGKKLLKLDAAPTIFNDSSRSPSNDIQNSELKALQKSIFELQMKYDIDIQKWIKKMKALESKSDKLKKQLIDSKQQIQEERNINKILKAEINNHAHLNKEQAHFLKVSYFILYCASYCNMLFVGQNLVLG